MKIVHSTRVSQILASAIFRETKAYFCFASFRKSNETEQLKNAGIAELRLEPLDPAERDTLARAYVECIGDLSSQYASLSWWAHPLSEKNEHLSQLFPELCTYHALIKVIEQNGENDSTLFIICPREMYAQLAISLRSSRNISVQSLDKPPLLALTGLMQDAIFAARSLALIALTFFRMVRARSSLLTRVEKAVLAQQPHYVIRTWFDGRYLDRADDSDAYFGALPVYIRRHYPLLIFAGILTAHRQVLSKIGETLRRQGDLVLPEEYFIKVSDLFRTIGQLFKKKIVIEQPVLFQGYDVYALIKSALSSGYRSGSFVLNIMRYHVARRLAQKVRIAAYIQPFENYAWEKMTLLGIRAMKPDIQLLGFQHAFISKSSFKYMLGRMERDIVPLPDRIITLGSITKNILERIGNHDPGRLEAGCALRQTYQGAGNNRKGNRMISRILVPLTMVHAESRAVLQFLAEAGLDMAGYEVVLRLHPATRMDAVVRELRVELPRTFRMSMERDVKDDLERADAVLYTWTTVAIEALRFGLPVIYLDILGSMNVDPLFECSALKKSVRTPGELLPALQNLSIMTDERYRQERSEAQAYLQNYLYPVNDKNLSAFLPRPTHAIV